MARRKDHSPEDLKQLILVEAEKLIEYKGLKKLTARALAASIGYAPGTIYNFYKDMDALIVDINDATMGRLHEFCQQRTAKLPADFSKITTLAYAYVDFAHDNRRAWETVFATTRTTEQKIHLPQHYQKRLADLFQLIEQTLQDCLKIPAKDARKTAHLLWACLHGITVLTLDGRLDLIGSDDPHPMIDDLLHNYLARYL